MELLQISHNIPPDKWEGVYKMWLRKSKTRTEVSLYHFINARADKGYRAKFLGTDNYFNIQAWSNSGLGALKDKLQNKISVGPQRAFTFGTCIHELLLEPEKINLLDDYCLRPSEIKAVEGMFQEARKHKLLMRVISNGQCEKEIRWTDTVTGFQCKAKVDILEKQGFDLKTSAAKNIDDFKDSVKRYEYDRQAAWYMDGITQNGFQCDKFTFIVIQKVAPFKIFCYTIQKGSDEYLRGVKKYKFLLNKAQLLDIEPII